MPSYASVAIQERKLEEEDYRLEFWAWDFVADRDTNANNYNLKYVFYNIRRNIG